MSRPAIFTEEKVRKIRLSLLSDRELARELSVSDSVINSVRNGRQWYARYSLTPDELEAAKTRKLNWAIQNGKKQKT